jgi:hypothetical protein
MRKRQIRILAVLGVFLLGAGGLGWAGGLELGVHGGITIPNLRGGQDNPLTRGFSSREGEFFGLTADIGLTRQLSLVVELNYTSQGGKRDGLQIIEELPPDLQLPPDIDLYANFRNETILDYIEIPVMGRLTFGHKARFFVNAGPYIGFLVRARAVTSGSSFIFLDPAGTQPVTPSAVSFDANTDVKDSLKTTNFGLAGGAGVKYPLGPGSLVLEAHFQAGLITIQRDIATSGSSQTGAVVISLGYLLSLR